MLAKITPCFENGKAALAAKLENGIAFGTTELHVLRPASSLDSCFLFYLVTSHPFAKAGEAAMYGAGGQKRVPEDFIKDFRLLLPPFETQRAIAAYLDRETAKIDLLIAKKRELIDKLKEQRRSALISRTVTRGLPPAAAIAAGLNPNPPMKDSGVEWLGEVPEHWRIKRLRFCLRSIEQGWSPSCHNHLADDDQWAVLKAGCVNGANFDETEHKTLPDEIAPEVRYEIKEGDVLVSRANTKELLGSAALVRTVRPKLLLCDKLYRLQMRHNLNSEFLILLLQSVEIRFQFEREATGTSGSMQNIGQDTIKNALFFLPPLAEQLSIVSFIIEEDQRLTAAAKCCESVIARLAEYRAALITAAVTGQIDVAVEH